MDLRYYKTKKSRHNGKFGQIECNFKAMCPIVVQYYLYKHKIPIAKVFILSIMCRLLNCRSGRFGRGNV